MCTQARHDEIKRCRFTFVAWTKLAGWQDDGGDRPLELRTCLICKSTLCDGTRR